MDEKIPIYLESEDSSVILRALRISPAGAARYCRENSAVSKTWSASTPGSVRVVRAIGSLACDVLDGNHPADPFISALKIVQIISKCSLCVHMYFVLFSASFFVQLIHPIHSSNGE